MFLAERRQILLQGMMFQPCVQGGLTQGGANLDRLADAHGVHTRFEQAFQQVVHGHVGFSGGENWAWPCAAIVERRCTAVCVFPVPGGP